MNGDKNIQWIIVLILCLVAVRGLLYGMLIPFNQAPDEYHHFIMIKTKHLQLNQASEKEKQRIAAQLELTKHYLLYPTSRPGKYTLEEFMGAELPDPPNIRTFYYWSAARILKIFDLKNVRDEIFVIRGFSLLCGILVVFLAFLSTQELFPENRVMIVGVPAFMAFVPQFSAMNGSVNNDKLAEVFPPI